VATPGIAQAGDAAVDTELTAALARLDGAFSDQDATAIRAMMTPDHTAVTFYYPGPQTVDEQLASLPKLEITFYDATPAHVDMLGQDAALITHEVSYRGTFNGNPVPQRIFASAVWVKLDGGWRERFYQETVIERE
jgi:ketosteroid isomerase-like protein